MPLGHPEIFLRGDDDFFENNASLIQEDVLELPHSRDRMWQLRIALKTTKLQLLQCSIKQISGWVFCVFFTSWVTVLDASQIPNSQDVGATAHFEKTEKEHAAMMKKISRRKTKVEIEGQEETQQKKPSKK